VAPAGRMIPLVENNYNCLRTGAARHRQEPHLQGDQPEQHPDLRRPDHGGQPVLQHGPPHGRLVGLWDVVAFDEVAGISFKDKDGVQIMKDYMASGSFARGRDSSTPTPRWCSSATSTSRSIPW
jgi:ATP-dependent Lon protease